MPRLISLSRLLIAVGICAAVAAPAAQQAEPPASQSTERAKELVSLLQAAELTSFAVKDPQNEGRFVALLHIPNVQLMVVSATYQRPSDIEYRIYHKEFMTAYMDLNSSTLSTERVFIEDTHADGLLLRPAQGSAGDVVRMGQVEQTFDGEFADPRRRNDRRMPQADYFKAYADADARYTRLLGVLIAALKPTTF